MSHDRCKMCGKESKDEFCSRECRKEYGRDQWPEGKEWPNPGSSEALALGCRCPIMDNRGGKGRVSYRGTTEFWITGACPMHGEEN